MPKYEYACKSCGEHIEVKQSFDDDPLTECPACGGLLRKVFSSPAIVLRGPGFYRTDHRSPYRPDGVMAAGKDKDPSESKSSSDSGGDSKGADSKSADSKGGDSQGSGSTGSGSKESGSKESGSKDSGGSRDSRGSESSSSRSRESRESQSSSGSGGPSSTDAARTA